MYVDLNKWGICESSTYSISIEFKLEDNLTVKALLSAHPVIRYDSNGDSKPSVIHLRNKRSLYLACDTSVCDELQEIQTEAPIHAFLPVNEDNYFRRKRVIGNMSVREAFGLADVVGIENVVPVHWDMFKSTVRSQTKSEQCMMLMTGLSTQLMLIRL